MAITCLKFKYLNNNHFANTIHIHYYLNYIFLKRTFVIIKNSEMSNMLLEKYLKWKQKIQESKSKTMME